MIPIYDLKHHSPNSAYKKIAEWVDDSDSEELSVNLGLSLPPDLGRSQYHQTVRCLFKEPQSNHISVNRKHIAIEKKAELFYQIVIDCLGGSAGALDLRKSPEQRKRIMVRLRENGFKVRDFIDIIQVAKAVRDGKFAQQSRHCSLNCYDMERLMDEFNRLNADESDCPVLTQIIREIDLYAPYPGRHLPFNKLRGRTAWRYQCLRMMDEILCTSEDAMSNFDMRQQIEQKCRSYGVEYQAISDTALKKMYVILKDLIKVEHNGDVRHKYRREVYVPGRQGHLYNTFDGNRRLSAFAVDIFADETFALKDEVTRLRKRFHLSRLEYPMICALGSIIDIVQKKDNLVTSINPVYNTDLVTVDFISSATPSLRSIAKKVIELNAPLGIYLHGNWRTVFPISIKNEGRQWAMFAKDIHSGAPLIISPDILVSSLQHRALYNPPISSASLLSNQEFVKDPAIGVTPLLSDSLFDITLRLTRSGIEDVEKEKSPLRPLTPRTKYYDAMYCDTTGTVEFQAYINRSLLDEFLRLDRTGKLISIDTPEVNDIYEEFFKQTMGCERVAFEDRPTNCKRLRRPKENRIGNKE